MGILLIIPTVVNGDETINALSATVLIVADSMLWRQFLISGMLSLLGGDITTNDLCMVYLSWNSPAISKSEEKRMIEEKDENEDFVASHSSLRFSSREIECE